MQRCIGDVVAHTGKKTHEIKRVIEHRITILMFNHIVILQRILKSFIKSKFDSTRFFPVAVYVIFMASLPSRYAWIIKKAPNLNEAKLGQNMTSLKRFRY